MFDPGSIMWALLAGVFVLLEFNRRRRLRVKYPSSPPSVTDKMAKVMWNFYEPAAPFVFLLSVILLVGGTFAVLFGIKYLFSFVN